MAGNIAPNIVKDGLVSYFDASNILSYVSGSAVWNNISRGSGSFSMQQKASSVFSFVTNPPAIFITQSAGVGGAEAINISGSLPFSENLSIELWYKTATTGSGFANQSESPGIMQIGSYNSNASLTLWDWSQGTPGNHNIRTFVNNGATWSHTALSTTTYSDAIWVNQYHHIVMNFSGSAGKWNRYNLYIDNILQSTVNFTIPFPSASISGNGTLNLSGASGGSARNSYSILKVYNRELTTTEIFQNYNALKGRFGL
jgi:hypothetical protein